MRVETSLTDKLEKEWDGDLFGAKRGLATLIGWDSYWTFRSKGSRAGFPDRTVVRERVLWAELKRELTGRKSEDANRQPSDAQREWLDRLARAGGEVYLWRPSDLQEVALILGHPWRHDHGVLSSTSKPSWVPASAWVAGHGRYDETTAAEAARREVA